MNENNGSSTKTPRVISPVPKPPTIKASGNGAKKTPPTVVPPKVAAPQKHRSSFEDILLSADSGSSASRPDKHNPPKRPRPSSRTSDDGSSFSAAVTSTSYSSVSNLSSGASAAVCGSGEVDIAAVTTGSTKLSWQEFVELESAKRAKVKKGKKECGKVSGGGRYDGKPSKKTATLDKHGAVGEIHKKSSSMVTKTGKVKNAAYFYAQMAKEREEQKHRPVKDLPRVVNRDKFPCRESTSPKDKSPHMTTTITPEQTQSLIAKQEPAAESDDHGNVFDKLITPDSADPAAGEVKAGFQDHPIKAEPAVPMVDPNPEANQLSINPVDVVPKRRDSTDAKEDTITPLRTSGGRPKGPRPSAVTSSSELEHGVAKQTAEKLVPSCESDQITNAFKINSTPALSVPAKETRAKSVPEPKSLNPSESEELNLKCDTAPVSLKKIIAKSEPKGGGGLEPTTSSVLTERSEMPGKKTTKEAKAKKSQRAAREKKPAAAQQPGTVFAAPPVKRGRGRPRKNPATSNLSPVNSESQPAVSSSSRGAPSKADVIHTGERQDAVGKYTAVPVDSQSKQSRSSIDRTSLDSLDGTLGSGERRRGRSRYAIPPHSNLEKPKAVHSSARVQSKVEPKAKLDVLSRGRVKYHPETKSSMIELLIRELSFEDVSTAVHSLNVPEKIPPEAYGNESPVDDNSDASTSEDENEADVGPIPQDAMMHGDELRDELKKVAVSLAATPSVSPPPTISTTSPAAKISPDENAVFSSPEDGQDGGMSRHRRKAVMPKRVDDANLSHVQHVQIPKIPKSPRANHSAAVTPLLAPLLDSPELSGSVENSTENTAFMGDARKQDETVAVNAELVETAKKAMVTVKTSPSSTSPSSDESAPPSPVLQSPQRHMRNKAPQENSVSLCSVPSAGKPHNLMSDKQPFQIDVRSTKTPDRTPSSLRVTSESTHSSPSNKQEPLGSPSKSPEKIRAVDMSPVRNVSHRPSLSITGSPKKEVGGTPTVEFSALSTDLPKNTGSSGGEAKVVPLLEAFSAPKPTLCPVLVKLPDSQPIGTEILDSSSDSVFMSASHPVASSITIANDGTIADLPCAGEKPTVSTPMKEYSYAGLSNDMGPIITPEGSSSKTAPVTGAATPKPPSTNNNVSLKKPKMLENKPDVSGASVIIDIKKPAGSSVHGAKYLSEDAAIKRSAVSLRSEIASEESRMVTQYFSSGNIESAFAESGLTPPTNAFHVSTSPDMAQAQGAPMASFSVIQTQSHFVSSQLLSKSSGWKKDVSELSGVADCDKDLKKHPDDTPQVVDLQCSQDIGSKNPCLSHAQCSDLQGSENKSGIEMCSPTTTSKLHMTDSGIPSSTQPMNQETFKNLSPNTISLDHLGPAGGTRGSFTAADPHILEGTLVDKNAPENSSKCGSTTMPTCVSGSECRNQKSLLVPAEMGSEFGATLFSSNAVILQTQTLANSHRNPAGVSDDDATEKKPVHQIDSLSVYTARKTVLPTDPSIHAPAHVPPAEPAASKTGKTAPWVGVRPPEFNGPAPESNPCIPESKLPDLEPIQEMTLTERPRFMDLSAEEEECMALYISGLAAKTHPIPKMFVAPAAGRPLAQGSTGLGMGGAGQGPDSGQHQPSNSVVDSLWYTRHHRRGDPEGTSAVNKNLPVSQESCSSSQSGGFLNKCALLRKLC